MRILHVSTGPVWRGGERQAFFLVEGSILRGIDVGVFALQGAPFAQKLQELGKVPLEKFERSYLKTFKNAKALSKIGQDYDLVHVHDSHAHSMAVFASFWGLPPIVVHRRVDFFPANSWLSRFKYGYKNILGYICVSLAVEKILKNRFKKLGISKPITTIHDSVDLDTPFYSRENLLPLPFSLPPQKKAKNCILIGNASALTKQKDYPTFLHTARKLIDLLKEKKDSPPVHFLIAGDGHLKNKLKKLRKKLDLDEYVTFLGQVPNFQKYIGFLDIFFMPSENEGLGTALLDALLQNVPVVSSKVGGVLEVVIPNKNGFLAPVGDVSGFAQHLYTLVCNENLRKELASAARASLLGFDKATMVEKTLTIYKLWLSCN